MAGGTNLMRGPTIAQTVLLALTFASTANAWQLRELHPFVEATADELPDSLGPKATRSGAAPCGLQASSVY